MVRRHYRCSMALDEAEIATTIIVLLNVRYGSEADIRLGKEAEGRAFLRIVIGKLDQRLALITIER
jgi:hypothetical protein